MAYREQSAFDLFGSEISPVVAGGESCECKGERHEVKEFAIASLYVGLFCHGCLFASTLSRFSLECRDGAPCTV